LRLNMIRLALAMIAMVACGGASIPPPDDLAGTAAAFGAREAVEQLSLSPDGQRIAFIAAGIGQRSTLYTVATSEGAEPQKVMSASGDPERLKRCDWVSNTRLACIVFGVAVNRTYSGDFSRILAVDADGSNAKLLSTQDSTNGGAIIDWLPDQNDAVLMVRAQWRQWTVERIDTVTLKSTVVEEGRDMATEYQTDGRGNVRIMGMARVRGATGYLNSVVGYSYRPRNARKWVSLGDYDTATNAGFRPYSVDAERDIVYGFMKKNGRQAAYEIALDGSGRTTLLYDRPDVDVGGFAYLGRQHRVIGVRYATDVTHTYYFDETIRKLIAAIGKALPTQPSIDVIDSSLDESKLLIFASGDTDPGLYYLFDRTSKKLTRLMAVRPQLADRKLAAMKAISYPAADGTIIPAYLTLPVQGSGRNAPAIVLPHGGPAARDEWGFDWLPQYFAARGYVVLQPQFRGSAGYGEEWFQNNGFQSWRTAVGDVSDAGRWLVSQGIADPSKLAIVGWSYGGYAALQSAVIDPELFKAVVAIAPVTDFAMLRDIGREYSAYRNVRNFFGSGPHIKEGSPAQNAARIRVPVLMFHGLRDTNVAIEQSRLMDQRLAEAGVEHELVTWEKLDHQLEDSAVRAELLRRSDAFLLKAMGLR
jgi:dipeptidyl aminopeptidase/acylaminoacyl peptidase